MCENSRTFAPSKVQRQPRRLRQNNDNGRSSSSIYIIGMGARRPGKKDVFRITILKERKETDYGNNSSWFRHHDDCIFRTGHFVGHSHCYKRSEEAITYNTRITRRRALTRYFPVGARFILNTVQSLRIIGAADKPCGEGCTGAPTFAILHSYIILYPITQPTYPPRHLVATPQNDLLPIQILEWLPVAFQVRREAPLLVPRS